MDSADSGKEQDATERRRALRARLIAAREALPAAEHARLSAALEIHLSSLLDRLTPKLIGYCWPFRREFDCRPLVTRWLDGAAEREAALAVVVASDAPLEFRPWRPGAPLIPGRYGIPVPRSPRRVQPDLLLLPVNGFDAAGYRLGYGGGYFDRTLASAARPLLAVGVGFELARLASIAPGPHDVPLDYVVTERGVMKRQRGRLLADRADAG